MKPVRAFFILAFALSACSVDRSAAPIVTDAPADAETQTVFFATNRQKSADGGLGFVRGRRVEYGKVTVSVPPNRDVGAVSNGGAEPDPRRDFAFLSKTDYADNGAFRQSLRKGQVAGSRELTVFVHGFNNSFSDAIFRMAQMRSDLDIPGASLVYAWPSRAHPLGYQYDEDSVIFARDGLEETLRTAHAATNGQLVLVAHSMGGYLLMEALRQIEILDPGWTDRSVSTVILISPDIGIDVFRSQMARIARVPEPFVIFVSKRDRALRLSAVLTGEPERLGNLRDAETVADLPVSIIDVTEFSDNTGINHFVPASSPALIAMLRRRDGLPQDFLRGRPGTPADLLTAQRDVLKNATTIILSPLAK